MSNIEKLNPTGRQTALQRYRTGSALREMWDESDTLLFTDEVFTDDIENLLTEKQLEKVREIQSRREKRPALRPCMLQS